MNGCSQPELNHRRAACCTAATGGRRRLARCGSQSPSARAARVTRSQLQSGRDTSAGAVGRSRQPGAPSHVRVYLPALEDSPHEQARQRLDLHEAAKHARHDAARERLLHRHALRHRDPELFQRELHSMALSQPNPAHRSCGSAERGVDFGHMQGTLHGSPNTWAWQHSQCASMWAGFRVQRLLQALAPFAAPMTAATTAAELHVLTSPFWQQGRKDAGLDRQSRMQCNCF